MAKKVQLMTNPKQWQVVDGVEVLVDVPQEDLDPITDSGCVEIEGHRTLEETISQENMFTPQITETKVISKVGGVYHDNVVDGAYEEAILYGNTQVNLVESMTSDTKYIPHSFTSFQGNESKIGFYHSGRTNQVAPLVKGVTMVNLAQTTSSSVTSGSGIWVNNIKPSTKYTLSLTYTIQNSRKGLIIQSYNDTTHLENSKQITSLETNVQLTFTTHANANAIRICNAEGYGGETIQLDNIMVIEGDVIDLDLPFFKGMRSVELSRPLTNLFADDLQIYDSNVTSTISNGNITVTSTSVNIWTSSSIYFKDLLKPNTKYLVMWDSLETTQTVAGETIISTYAFTSNTNLKTSDSDIIRQTLRSYVFDTGNFDVNDIVVRIHATTSNSETGITTVTGLRVFEWDDSLRTLDLQAIGYFSGTKYVSVRALETEGKNLYPYGDVNFTSVNTSWFDSKGTELMYGDIALKSKARFLLKKGSYIASFSECTNVYNSNIQIVDDKEEIIRNVKIDNTSATFTLMNDTYCTVRVMPSAADVSVAVKNIQIERGETATTYEAYQSRYYKPRETEEIILRSLPNGVCDTFNLQTGELVQRIGEIVLDENESWSQDITASESTPNTNIFYTAKHEEFKPLATAQRESGLLCDKMKVIASLFSSDVVGVMTNLDPRAYIRLPKNVASDVTSLKTYLQSNPVTVQYELKEPIITKLQTNNRVYNGQSKEQVFMGNNLSALTYYSNNYYLKVGNLSPVPAILEPITTIPYDVRLKPSTLYTIKYNRGANSNSMKFDLGGSVVEKTNVITNTNGIAEEFTVKTPAILSHEQLILSGTGFAHNFIVVEGDITGTELPYFEGMKDVKMPIVKNVGKNLFDIQSIYQELKNIAPNNVLLLNDNTLRIKSTGDWHQKDLGKPIKFKKNTRYTLSFNAQDINNIGGLPDTIICFVYTDGTTSFSRAWGDNVFISTAGKTVDYINFSFGFGDGRAAEFSNFMLVEGTETQPYVPYKENSVYAVQGEYPITSEMMEQGGFSASLASTYEDTKYDNAARLRSKDLIPVKPNTTYAFSHSFSKFGYNVYQWNGNKKFIDGVSRYFADGQIETITTTADTQYIHFLISKHDASQTITVAEYDWSQFHMYELDSTINLRSLPNGVKDELNLLTGEYIQRVGEVVIDGSQSIYSEKPNYKRMYIIKDDMKKLQNYSTGMVCDKINVSVDYSQLSSTENTWVSGHTDTVNLYPNRNWIYFNIENIEDVSSMTTYLQSNPITVQYELAEPIISYPRLVSNNQEREVGVKLPNGVCNTYNPSTGITTVRVGKVVLDGSEEWKEDAAATKPTDLIRFSVEISDMRKGRPYNTGDFVYESNIGYNIVNNDKISPRKLPNIWNYYENNIYMDFSPTAISMTTSDTTETKLSKIKTHLASNPVTVWYELNYPQIQPDIVLPNGVHDEYNPETGVYTKKVGKIEFDGSEDWMIPVPIVETPSVYGVWTTNPIIGAKYGETVNKRSLVVCDCMASYNNELGLRDEEFCFISNSGRFNMNILRSKLSESTESVLKAYLSQNPIKVSYELATPITYQLTPYFGLPQPYAYEDGYLIHDSVYAETTLPPEFKYKLVANRTGQVMQNSRKLQEHTTRLSNLEALIIEATIESLFNRELQLFELELMDIQLIDLGE